MGSTGSINSLITKINNMPAYVGDNSEAVNQLREAPADIDKQATDLYRQLRDANSLNYEVREVAIADLYTKQGWLFKENLKDIAATLKGTIEGDKAIPNAKSSYDSGIRAVEYKGYTIVIDGNHRLNVALLNNQTRMKIRVAKIG